MSAAAEAATVIVVVVVVLLGVLVFYVKNHKHQQRSLVGATLLFLGDLMLAALFWSVVVVGVHFFQSDDLNKVARALAFGGSILWGGTMGRDAIEKAPRSGN